MKGIERNGFCTVGRRSGACYCYSDCRHKHCRDSRFFLASLASSAHKPTHKGRPVSETVIRSCYFSLLTGLLLTFIGTPLTIFLLVIEGKSLAVLGGLIPLSIGAALLVFYGVKRHERNS
jgi:hypothetical protein